MQPQFNRIHAARFLRHLIDPAIGCSELRIPKSDISKGGIIGPAFRFPKTIGGYFNRVDSFIASLMKVDGISPYITVNPVDKRKLSIINNTTNIIGSGQGTSEDNIVCIRWIYIDIDCSKMVGSSATDTELQGCIRLRDKVLADHPDFVQNGMWGRSGNGCWILVRLQDLLPTEANKGFIYSALNKLAKQYGEKGKDSFFIDTTTHDMSRIMVIPGTLKCKGVNLPEYPWRLATLDGEFGTVL